MKKKNLMLKKLVSLVSLTVLAVLVLVGCGAKETTRTFEMEQNGMKLTTALTAKGDKVQKEVSSTVIPYTSGMDKETAKAAFDPTYAAFKEIDGIEVTTDYDDEQLTVKIVVDYSKADLDALKAVMPNVSGDAKNGVSLETTASVLEKAGYKEVK